MTSRPTIAAIAEAAGVSTASVSYALNGVPGVSAQTRERVLAVADELGWRPSIAARSLSSARAHAVGLVLARPGDTLGLEPFFMRFILGLERELATAGFALVLQLAEDHRAWNRTVSAWWAERRVDAVVVTDLHSRDSRIPVLRKLGVPCVIAGRPQRNLTASTVWVDDGLGVRSAVESLLSQGHRRIARVAGLHALDHTRARAAAFDAVMRVNGLVGDVVETDYTYEGGMVATRQLLDRPVPPTAVLYDSDLLAVAGANCARELGLGVPTDLSIIAGDDSTLCEVSQPPLTALSRDVVAFGSTVARALIEQLSGHEPSLVEAPAPVLVVRGSTGPPSA
ncbi:MAG: LacI family DNA-binding transcriptional regulator [Phycicoccus sp.]|nr:LacI family DNA-binding transcriptional regulator [Phycicoccus sp.]